MYDILVEITENKEISKGMFNDTLKKIIVMKSGILTVEVVQ